MSASNRPWGVKRGWGWRGFLDSGASDADAIGVLPVQRRLDSAGLLGLPDELALLALVRYPSLPERAGVWRKRVRHGM